MRSRLLLLSFARPAASFVNYSRPFSSSTSLKMVVKGDESIMAPKAHGTSPNPVQQDLKWGCSTETADKICSFNRHYAEHSGYWTSTNYLKEIDQSAPQE